MLLLQPQSLASAAEETDDDAAIVTAVTRTYYIQAEQELWDYFPSGMDRLRLWIGFLQLYIVPCQTEHCPCKNKCKPVLPAILAFAKPQLPLPSIAAHPFGGVGTIHLAELRETCRLFPCYYQLHVKVPQDNLQL